ncbi:MAG: hypothetical protein DRH12_11825 [Deltaproteobacteria bacterium]|nr:MAG: hypothetical protein DRH12_11825 [Deltaproteobacteria bacterium]
MELALSPEEKQVQETVAKFVRKEILPLKKELEIEGQIPEGILKGIKDVGLLKGPFPRKYGGADATFTSLAVGLRELSYGSFVTGWPTFENFMLAYPLYKYGSDFLKDRYLPGLISLERMGALAFTEPNTGSDPKQIVTSAVRKNEAWEITGTKRFITLSGICDHVILFAKTTSGLTAFLVNRSQAGYKSGKRESLISWKGLDNGDIYLENYICPQDHVIGHVGQGFEILLDTEAIGKVLFSAMFVGLAQRALDLSIEYSNARLHRWVPIGNKFQMTQYKIADMAVNVEGMKALLLVACAEIDKGKNVFKRAAEVKLFVSNQVKRVAALAMEVHGAYGLSMEYEIGLLYSQAIAAQVVMGSMDIQRVIVAKETLRGRSRS